MIKLLDDINNSMIGFIRVKSYKLLNDYLIKFSNAINEANFFFTIRG
jgi:hypothetical protein